MTPDDSPEVFHTGNDQLHPRVLSPIVDHEASLRALAAVVEFYPTAGTGVINGIDIRRGGADTVHVDIFWSADRETGRSLQPAQIRDLQGAVSKAIQTWRHQIRVVERR